MTGDAMASDEAVGDKLKTPISETLTLDPDPIAAQLPHSLDPLNPETLTPLT